jgi:hypothetical protein
MAAQATKVYLEIGTKKVFASAADWPGWSRSGKGDEGALEALAAYLPRFAEVAAEAGLTLPADAGGTFEVVERLPGDMTTDFGAPGAVAEAERIPLPADAVERLVALVTASWAVLDRVVAATPAELRKGPRGGGRDRDKMVDHVLGAEAAYARKVGARHRQPALHDSAAIAAMRGDILAALRSSTGSATMPDKGWPPAYASRRIAWHVLDHAWEMQDRSS